MSKHAKERALERYGIELDVVHVIQQIRENLAIKHERISKNKGVYEVDHHGIPILVLYHRQQRAIITVLPHEHLHSPNLKSLEAQFKLRYEESFFKK
jgi:fructose-1-phosphate kinase PfkB-like protein